MYIVIAKMYDGSEKSFWINAESAIKAESYVMENKEGVVSIIESYR